MIENPCKTCPMQGCGAFHDECIPYKKFKETVAKEKLAMKNYKDKNAIIGEIKPKKKRRKSLNAYIKSSRLII